MRFKISFSQFFNAGILALQAGVAFAVCFLIYMLYALIDTDGGFPALLGLALVHPVFGILISALSVFICLLIGLPIRLIAKFRSWWKKHFYISFILFLLGVCALIIANLSGNKEELVYELNGVLTSKSSPNTALSFLGYYLVCFGISHLFLPAKWEEFIKHLISPVWDQFFKKR